MVNDSTDLACPFCGGEIWRIVEPRARPSFLESLGLSIALEFLFWCALGLAALLWFWSVPAAVAVALAVGVGLFFWWPRRFTYRCGRCETVLTYPEVKRARQNAV
jgi:hypothetical protein